MAAMANDAIAPILSRDGGNQSKAAASGNAKAEGSMARSERKKASI